MNNAQGDQEAYRTLQLMNELVRDDCISQRELAGRLGIAVGLVNSYLKNLAAKGFLRVKNYPRNRYAYLLTPKGIAEKSRLAYQHLHYFNNLYTLVRQDYLTLFRKLKEKGVDGVVFCGVDEVAEIACLSLQEAGLVLTEIVEERAAGIEFIGRKVKELHEWQPDAGQPVVLTSLKRSVELRQVLMARGVTDDLIFAPNGKG